RLESGLLQVPMLAEVLEYELALNEFRYTPRLEVLAQLDLSKSAPRESTSLQLHPLIRVLLFRHDPRRVLELLEERRAPPHELAEGEFWLLLDGKSEDVEIKLIDPGFGRLLKSIAAGTAPTLGEADVELLIESGLC